MKISILDRVAEAIARRTSRLLGRPAGGGGHVPRVEVDVPDIWLYGRQYLRVYNGEGNDMLVIAGGREGLRVLGDEEHEELRRKESDDAHFDYCRGLKWKEERAT